MTCKSALVNLSAYIDRELGTEDANALREHLVDCPSCKSEEIELRQLKSLLEHLPSHEPRAEFEERLIASVFREDVPSQVKTRGPVLHSVMTFAAVAACVMAVTLGLMRYQSAQKSPTNAPEDISFEVHRDQMYAVGADATSGPLVVPANYGTR